MKNFDRAVNIQKKYNIGFENLTRLFMVSLIFITNISQLPFIVEKGYSSVIAIGTWGAICFFMIPFFKIRLNLRYMLMLVSVFLFFSSQCILELFYSGSYIFTELSSPLYMTFMIFSVGFWVSPLIDKKTFKKINKSYVLSVVILSIAVYIKFFLDGINWNATNYVYASKNSISQILFTAVLIIFFDREIFSPKTRIGIGIFITYIILALKSRATIVGYILLLGYFLYSNSYTKKIKIYLCLSGAFILGSLLIVNYEYYINVFANIILNGRDFTNLDAISSGRISILKNAINMFEYSEFWGIGSKYIECFYIAAIVQHGIFFGMFIIFYAVYPFFAKVCILENDYAIKRLFKFVVLTYCINGIFECVAPLGPGVKCYYLWFLFGILSNFQSGMRKSEEIIDVK